MSIEWSQPTTTAQAPALWEQPVPSPSARATAPMVPALWDEPTQVDLPSWDEPTQITHAPAPSRNEPTPLTHAPQGVVPPVATSTSPRPVAGAEHPLQVASLGRRLGAYVLDALVLGIGGGLLLAGLDAALGMTETTMTSDSVPKALAALVAYVVTLNVIQFAYLSIPALPGMRGQSLGKRALGIRFVRTDGTRASAGLALGRAAATLGPTAVLTLVFVLAAGGLGSMALLLVGMVVLTVYPVADHLLAPLAGVGRQTLHDRMARTVVVDAGPASPAPGVTPARIAGRACTAATWSFGIGLSSVLTGLVLLFALLAAIGSALPAASSYEPQESYDAAPYSLS